MGPFALKQHGRVQWLALGTGVWDCRMSIVPQKPKTERAAVKWSARLRGDIGHASRRTV